MARDAAEALRVVSAGSIDLVLCDVRMPGISGLELVRQIHDTEPDLPCIVITGYGGPQSSIEALRAGAFWYLEKPFDQDHLGVIRLLVDQAIEHGRLKSENRNLHNQLRSRYKPRPPANSQELLPLHRRTSFPTPSGRNWRIRED